MLSKHNRGYHCCDPVIVLEADRTLNGFPDQGLGMALLTGATHTVQLVPRDCHAASEVGASPGSLTGSLLVLAIERLGPSPLGRRAY